MLVGLWMLNEGQLQVPHSLRAPDHVGIICSSMCVCWGFVLGVGRGMVLRGQQVHAACMRVCKCCPAPRSKAILGAGTHTQKAQAKPHMASRRYRRYILMSTTTCMGHTHTCARTHAHAHTCRVKIRGQTVLSSLHGCCFCCCCRG